jgi:hypothetical protein
MKIKKSVVKPTTKSVSRVVSGTKGVQKVPKEPKAAKGVVAPTEKSAERNGINIGRTTGLRVMAFQDLTLATNDVVKRPGQLAHIPGQLTDTELAKVWREEFPNSRAVQAGRIDESIVRGVRNLYNQGTQGHGTTGKTHDSKPFILADGKRVVSGYTRAKKGAAVVEAKAVEAKKSVKGPAVVETKMGKVRVVGRQKATKAA